MPAKKAAATSASTAALIEEVEKEAETRFGALRDRAQKARRRIRQKNDFVLDKEWGFDPAVRVKFPLNIRRERDFEYAIKEGDIHRAVECVLGTYDYERVLTALEDEPESGELFDGFAEVLISHWLGRGAGEVPGGTEQS